MKNRLALELFLLLALPCLGHKVVEKDDSYVVTHEWKFQDRQWSCNLSIPVNLYQYYLARAHRSDNMVQFVLSDYDRDCVQGLVHSFFEGGSQVGYSNSDNMRSVIAFVQSLSYVSDAESKGEDDYVRFPVETLVDGEGDCEDMAILAAAILDEMGYDVLLVELPEHLALAVKCDDDTQGTYYDYQGSRYYYLEVTNTGWNIGQIPDDYKNSRVTLWPLVYQPCVRLLQSSYRHDYYYSTDLKVPFEVECELENPGPGPTKGLSVHVLFKTHGGHIVVDKDFPLDELIEGESSIYELRINVPRPFSGILEVRAEGANFGTEFLRFEDIELQ